MVDVTTRLNVTLEREEPNMRRGVWGLFHTPPSLAIRPGSHAGRGYAVDAT